MMAYAENVRSHLLSGWSKRGTVGIESDSRTSFRAGFEGTRSTMDRGRYGPLYLAIDV